MFLLLFAATMQINCNHEDTKHY